MPSQPLSPMTSMSIVCQMSMQRKWERFDSSQPTPWSMAMSPRSYISFSGAIAGFRPISSSILSTRSSGTPSVCRLSTYVGSECGTTVFR